ncbi:MAG: HAD family hydrolase [Leptotrichiaceae bacterium]|nr:HAD family hydrolase [Leptotrichiaceae bacterium]
MEKYIFLDRDGTINVEKHYLHKIEDFEYENGVLEALEGLQKLGYKFIIVTNQAGIAKGYYTERDYLILEEFIEKDLLKKGIIIQKTYHCPHHPQGKIPYNVNCECRKPKTGMFIKAIEEFNIDIENSYMVGDRFTDLKPADELGIYPVLIKTGYGEDQLDALIQSDKTIEGKFKRVMVVENLMDLLNKLHTNNKN